MSWNRYGYLKAPHGGFYNPFDKGKMANVLEFFHIKSDDQSSSRVKKRVDII